MRHGVIDSRTVLQVGYERNTLAVESPVSAAMKTTRRVPGSFWMLRLLAALCFDASGSPNSFGREESWFRASTIFGTQWDRLKTNVVPETDHVEYQ
jgi:hypothetical protein